MSAHPGSSFMWLIRVHSWSVKKHGMKHYALSEGKKLHITLYRRLALWCMGLRSLATPRSRWYFAVQRVVRSVRTWAFKAGDFVVRYCLSNISANLWPVNIHRHPLKFVVKSGNTWKSAHPPLWQACKIVRCSAHGHSFARIWYTV